jgi:hypothetical protein
VTLRVHMLSACCCAEHGGSGVTTQRPEMPHTCMAYQLLRGYGETVDVGDWFASFCLALGAQASGAQQNKKSGKGASARKRRKKMKTVERTCTGAGTSQAAPDDVEGDVGEVGLFVGCFTAVLVHIL